MGPVLWEQVRTSVLCEWSWQPAASTARLPRGIVDQQPVLQHYHQYFEAYSVLKATSSTLWPIQYYSTTQGPYQATNALVTRLPKGGLAAHSCIV